MLKVNRSFTACPVDDGDELYANGIFVFNITRMLDYIENNHDSIALVEIVVSDFPEGFSSINEAHIESVDVSLPLVLAEISPGHYSLIDGNHRMEKACRLKVPTMSAYKLDVMHHMPFLTSKEAYLSYIEYWNSKLR